MASGTPVWRMAFDAAERCVAIPLESIVRSDLFFDALAVSTRARGGAFARTERLSRRALHLVNLPAGSDMRRLGDQVARLERRVVALSKQIEAEGTAASKQLEAEATAASSKRELTEQIR